MATAVGQDLTVPVGEVRTYALNADNNVMAALLIGDFDAIEGQVYFEPTIINYGEMHLGSAGYGTGSLLHFATSLTWNEGVTKNYGLMSAVTPTLDSVRVLFAPGPSPDVFNYAAIVAEARNRAIGFESWDGGSVFVNGPNAIVQAKAAAQALALYFPNGGPVINEGQLLAHVTGGTSFPDSEAATGIMFGFGNFAGFSLQNTGLIQATGTNSAQLVEAIAIRAEGTFSIVNSGTIRGVDAIVQYATGNAQPFGNGNIENSGLIDGQVVLARGSDTFMNSGQVIGNVSLGAGNDLYDGATGSIAGEVHGGDGNDVLIGGAGNEVLFGDGDDDTIFGGVGVDRLDGGAGADTASYASDEGAVFVNLTLGQGFGNAAQGDTYVSIENVVGGGYNDFIIGDPGANRLDGGAGDDILIGAIGPDGLAGGSGIDTASYEDNSGTVFVNLTLNAGSNNAAQGDTYDGIENLKGGLFDDFFIGDEQANRLDGAMGADTLMGAGGADTFVFAHLPGAASGFDHPNSSANIDTILDFTRGEDTIELLSSSFGAMTPGALNTDAFVLGTHALDPDDRIIYDQTTGNLYYDADGSGSGAAVLFAVLDNQAPLSATDFAIAAP